MADDGVRAVLLGAPGCGKGTQAGRLESALAVPAISTGELLRQAIAAGTSLGERVAATVSSGQLVSDELMAEVVRERVGAEDARRGFVLDGYPRTTTQALTLDRLLAESGAHLDAVVFLDVPKEVLVRRALARRREDDQEPVIRRRLALYGEKTAPLVEHYRERGLLHRIDGDREVNEVTQSILSVLRSE
ncbi:MAG TPA: adenylate kinase [Thermoanaerobaculia bacterium]|jgi:adenylate kinase